MAATSHPDDRSNDVHVPLDHAHFDMTADVDQVQVPNSMLDTGLVEGVKIATEHTKQEASPTLDSSRGPSLSTNPDLPSDATSIHSMPAVLVSEPTPSDPPRPSTAVSSPSESQPSQPLNRRASAVPTGPASQQETNNLSQQQRRARHRSAIEVRSSNRLSGFFNNLIHRRDALPSSSAHEAIAEDQSAAKPSGDRSSRSESPTSAPTVIPPPALPPPTLQELGLSLSVLTSDLTPAHFTTPPASGAFLAPHYLLLCHAQGLDVLPLVSPPAPQPYALVRRVAFKSIVIMEHRGVLVAIAGRRDGVRVYALEEVKKAIEWRIDVEIRRERERLRREAAKKNAMRSESDLQSSGEKVQKMSLSVPPPTENVNSHVLRKSSHGNLTSVPPPPPLIPRAPRTPTRKSRISSLRIPPSPPGPPQGQPPPYPSPTDTQPPPLLRSQPSALSVRARARSSSVSNVLAGVSAMARNGESSRARDMTTKSDDWAGSSDDEAIDIRATASGSQALDERTSATLAANRSSPGVAVAREITRPRVSTGSSRRRRPSNLDLSAAHNTAIPHPEPSPTPTLLTLRQALQQLPLETGTPDTFDDLDDDEDEADGRISLAQALLESRLPELPPPGSVQPQQPILLSATPTTVQESSNPRTLEGNGSVDSQNTTTQPKKRRRWSILLTGSSTSDRSRIQNPASSSQDIPQSNFLSPSAPTSQINGRPTRSPSLRSNSHAAPTINSSSSVDPALTAVEPPCTSITPSSATSTVLTTPRSSRFIHRIISNALSRRSDERLPPPMSAGEIESVGWLGGPPLPPQAPPPKLEYVKLPGTKGTLMIKAVETQKKSFLAILCGENGEKVELFAGTYRTALGLSRTFILPDSPRSLELQLQGDDLVEVFLVFSQNVFGLEPATVRVREVRIGRAERRAARRRARENRAGETTTSENDPNEDEMSVNVSIGVSVAVGSTAAPTGDGPDRPSTPTLIAPEHPDAPNDETRAENQEPLPTTTTAQPEELLAVATAQMGPYTTFQQLSFSPNFPLASVADEYIIPPPYPNFIDSRRKHDQEGNSDQIEPTQTQFSPPGLPAPPPSGPTQWYYKDPKGVMHGPWNSSLMQAWHRDGLLPADLPVRREGETAYILLKDLKMQCVDPAHPFRSPPPLLSSAATDTPKSTSSAEDLLQPISLLAQPKHFGPPALFFSSRGGHSTAIVDARGRSVLKSRFVWSNDDSQDDAKTSGSKMGDVRRLEALDVKDRSVLVAMRQGGLEAVDLSDALLRPADQSRTILPSFNAPPNTINRRPPFVWKIGTPINSSNTTLAALSSKGKTGLSSLPKKTTMGIAKSTIGSQGSVDFEGDPADEVLFLGRKDDEIYFCERNAGSFRILRLCPDTNG